MADETPIRLTTLSHDGGCGCKIAPAVLDRILSHATAPSAQWPGLLVGNHSRDDAGALEATLEKTGSALRWNVVVLALGFASLSLSSLKPNHSLGLLLAWVAALAAAVP